MDGSSTVGQLLWNGPVELNCFRLRPRPGQWSLTSGGRGRFLHQWQETMSSVWASSWTAGWTGCTMCTRRGRVRLNPSASTARRWCWWSFTSMASTLRCRTEHKNIPCDICLVLHYWEGNGHSPDLTVLDLMLVTMADPFLCSLGNQAFD